jgi:plastocyanin
MKHAILSALACVACVCLSQSVQAQTYSNSRLTTRPVYSGARMSYPTQPGMVANYRTGGGARYNTATTTGVRPIILVNRTSAPLATPTNGSTTGGSSVEVGNAAATPTSLTVSPGTTVTFRSTGTTERTLMGNGGMSITIPAGGTGSYTYATPGTFTYRNRNKPSITGTVIVQ